LKKLLFQKASVYLCAPFNNKKGPIVNTLSYKTVSANNNTVQRDWYVVDADGQTLGRMATQIAHILRGKNKPYYTPHTDCGDFIIVINAEKVHLTGNKWDDKTFLTYSLYPGGQKSINMRDLRAKDATRIIENAVRGMLPKTKLGRAMIKKLFVYEGTEHPHQAQQPKVLTNDK
jgi:large subunit ribosomal protein L13